VIERALWPLALIVSGSVVPPAVAGADGAPGASAAVALDEAAAGRLAALALACVHQEYPNKISHVLQSDADARPARELTPAFYGCYDWHSSVHGHWLLARLVSRYPEAPFAGAARVALGQSLTQDNLAAERAYMEAAGRASFERPYGLAWLLALAAELRRWDEPLAQEWSKALAPLEALAAGRIASWLPKLLYPVRSGEHSQSAFAFGLIRDWSVIAGNEAMRSLIDAKAVQFYLADRGCPLAYEPSGEDFLSPCLAEADLMRRVLPQQEYARWLSSFLPMIATEGSTAWLQPAEVSDRADPKLAHIDGLNLSRAWMLDGIASALDPTDSRVAALRKSSAEHAAAALPAVTGEHYEGGHWLGTFAVYLLTRAGIRPG
jgi:hypothetical protein